MDIDEVESKELKEFQLSSILAGMDEPIRRVKYIDNNVIVALGTKGRIMSWKRSTINKFQASAPFRESLHTMGFDLKVIPKVAGLPEGSCFSSGSTGEVRFWTIAGDFVGPNKLESHKDIVCSIDMTKDGDILTGGYDEKAKLWRNGKCVATMEGSMHKYGVVVCGLASGEIVTGSYKGLVLWDSECKHIKTVADAHDHVIRQIVPHPLGLATCANDGYIKIWTNKLEQIQQIHAHPNTGGDHQMDFIYGLHALSNGMIVSCGEDCTMRIFGKDGKLLQVVAHPSSVWSVGCLPNGDLLSGAADTNVRIWTLNPERVADKEVLQSHEDFLKLALQAKNLDDIDEAQISDASVLTMPGAPGAIKIVRQPEGPTVFQYDAAKSEWVKVGLAVGKKQAKPNINGVDYDFVTDVQVDKRSIKLGFNKWQDPVDVARKFCVRYGIQVDEAQQIIQHLRPMADPVARQKYLMEQEEKKKAALQLIPTHKVCRYELSAKWEPAKMKAKILEFNESLLLDESAFDVKSNEEVFEELMLIIEQKGKFHSSKISHSITAMVLKLLNWPTKHILPILDMCRVLCLHADFCAKTAVTKEFRQLILNHLESDDKTHLHDMITCRMIANYLAKRPRSDKERHGHYEPELGEFISEVVDSVSEIASSEKQSLRTAYVFLCLNVILWVAKLKIDSSSLFLVMASGLCEVLAYPNKDAVIYYSISILGTMGFVLPEAKLQIKEAYEDTIRAAIEKAKQSAKAQTQRVAFECSKVFML